MYPNLRAALDPRLQSLPDEAIEQLVESSLGAPAYAFEQLSPPMEDFWRDAGRWAARIAPGVVSGAASGAALGPYGALGGALLGGVSSALAPTPSGRPSPPPTPPAPLPPAPAAPASANPARDFAALLGRPEVSQALAASALGANGRSTVRVGGTEVPVAAVMNLLSSLLAGATAAAPPREDLGEDVPRYLLDATGSLRCDPTASGERAAVLYELFQSTEAELEAEWDEDLSWPEEPAWEEVEADLYESLVDAR